MQLWFNNKIAYGCLVYILFCFISSLSILHYCIVAAFCLSRRGIVGSLNRGARAPRLSPPLPHHQLHAGLFFGQPVFNFGAVERINNGIEKALQRNEYPNAELQNLFRKVFLVGKFGGDGPRFLDARVKPIDGEHRAA